MTIGIRIKFSGMTEEEFSTVNALIDPEANPPSGLRFHASGPIEEGWGVIDFWESRAAFDTFQETRIGPAVAASGLQMTPPDVKEFPVFETFPR